MILATVITNLVMALMIREANVALDNDGNFHVSSVKTQYIHSVTLHEFDSMYMRDYQCLMCNKPIEVTPIDYLGVKPCRMEFYSDDLRKNKYHPQCNPWIYINTNVWFNVINSDNYRKAVEL